MGALALIVLLVIMGFEVFHVYGEISTARTEEAALAAQLKQQKEENAALEADLKRSDDPEFYEDLARSELGLAQDGERIFYDVNN